MNVPIALSGKRKRLKVRSHHRGRIARDVRALPGLGRGAKLSKTSRSARESIEAIPPLLFYHTSASSK